MKRVFAVLLVLAVFASLSFAGWVKGYTRSNGTSVSGHYRADSNSTVQDNYSYKGNRNPYTNEEGSNYYRKSESSEYYGTQPKQHKSIWGE